MRRNSGVVRRAQTNCWMEDLSLGLRKERERLSSVGTGWRERVAWKIS